ncbi:helix-turn-helix domain-containing protein [Streptomyces canus]|uniref:helix-turn-helix domain-containing protein n=1 Tax=Streptomyces canus TaxID=58343 RepID=UPI003F4B93E8
MYATGESQTEPAAALGVSRAQVSRRRSGTAAWSLADCDAVAAHYGIDPLDLLAGLTRATETLPAQRCRVAGRGLRPATARNGGARQPCAPGRWWERLDGR